MVENKMKKIVDTYGISMSHFIEPNDKLIVETKVNKIRLGDVVLYNYIGDIVAHRVYFCLFKHCVAAGDNCHRFEFFSTKDILGKAVFIIRDKITYKIDTDSIVRKKYRKFLLLFVIFYHFTVTAANKSLKTPIEEKLSKMLNMFFRKRNKMQEEYLLSCKIIR